MKNLFLLLFCLSMQMSFGQESDVKQTIVDFFDGFHAKDTLKMRNQFAKEIVMHSVSERNQQAVLKSESATDFLKMIASIPKSEKFEERLLSYKIQIDGAMAHVWTPYEFYINGKLSHTGVNSFQLFNDSGKWKITYCIDTRKRP